MNSILPLRIEIPQFVRKVKLSNKQKATYFVWNGTTIKGKTREIPINWYKDKNTAYQCREKKITRIEDLKSEFTIGIFQKNIVSYTNKTEIIDNTFDSTKNKYILSKVEIIKDEYIVTPIICNEKKVGTPKFYLIKGQDIYSGNLREHARGNIMNKIKECYEPYLKDILPIVDYPVKIECELYDTVRNFYSKQKDQRWDVDNYAYPYMKAFPDLLVEKKILFDDDRLHLTQPPTPIFCPIEKHEDRKLVFIISKDDRDIIKNNEIYQSYHKNKNTMETEDLDLVKEDKLFCETINNKENGTPF